MTEGSNTAVSPTITDRLLALRYPQHASLSPDGRQLLLTTAEVPLASAEELIRVTVVDIATGAEHTVGAIELGEHSATWAPDGRSIAWLAQHDGDDVVKIAETVAGPARVIVGTAGAAGPPAWSPDGRFLVLPARRGTAVDRSQPYRWTRPIAHADGIGALDDPPQLLLVSVADGATRWLTDDGWRWSSPSWSPEGTHIAATVGIDPEGRRTGSQLRLVSVGGDVTESAVPSGRSIAHAWLPDGRLAVLVAEPRTGKLGGEAELFVVEADHTRPIEMSHLWGDVYGDNPAVLPESYENVLLSDGTGRLVVRVGARGQLGVARLHPDHPEATEVLASGPRCCTPVAAVGDTVIATTQDMLLPPELAIISRGEGDLGGTERTITAFGREFESTLEVRRFTIDNDMGAPLDGWFVAPAGRNAPVPTVVTIHGGPHFTFGEIFSIDTHALCDAGFGVLFTNPRGSTGYGAAFAQACHCDWSDGPARDILAVLDHAVEAGWVDPLRVGISGLSYGGYLSAWLASTTRRFAAAVIENPVTDLMSMYGTSDIGVGFFPNNFGGAPHEALDLYARQSPIMRAHDCRTPCLWVIGEADRRCPPAQAWAMHRVLCHVGTPSEVLVLPNCSHEGTTYGPPVSRRAHDSALVEWMTRWL